MRSDLEEPTEQPHVTLFLCGDVMLGRGVDQLLEHPSRPALRESSVHDARTYAALVEAKTGLRFHPPLEPAWFWGDALEELERARPDARLINLETSITTSEHYWPGKGIHYRMHPDNLAALSCARIDACALANNHLLDFGREGLLETLDVLHGTTIRTSGAGRTREEAEAPARLPLPGGGTLLFMSAGAETSGIPEDWAATETRPGVALLPELSEATARALADRLQAQRRPGELCVVSLHWGGNWGYEVSRAERLFARALIDGGVDLVHGHSSHHARPLEVHRGKLILYGCGDFIDDYEGIQGYEPFRDDLRPMYLATLNAATGALIRLEIVLLQSRQLRLVRASEEDVGWWAGVLSEESHRFGVRLRPTAERRLRLEHL